MVCERAVPALQSEATRFVSAEYVERAREMLRALVWAECLGPNCWSEARQRVSERFGISAGLIRDLEYRPPKTLPAHTYARIEAAFGLLRQRTFAEIWGAASDTGAEAAASHSLVVGIEGGGVRCRARPDLCDDQASPPAARPPRKGW